MDKRVYQYISSKTNDPIVEWRKCKISGEDFPIFQSDIEFYDKVSLVFDSKKYPIPLPTLSPEVRHMRRMNFRNDRSLYSRKCDGTWNNIICMYAPDKPYKVYDRDYRWSDNWSAMDYGFDFDFTKTFTEQFDKLLKTVPLSGVLNSNSENSKYVNQTDGMKNSYLMFSCCDCENCYFGNRAFDCKYCLDCNIIYNSENCYECIDGYNLYKCFFSQNIKDCSNSYFLFDCIGCKDCFGCRNLRNKQYCVYNKQYTKEEYEKELSKLLNQIKSCKWLEELKNNYNKLLKENAIYRVMHLDNCENVYGWFQSNSKDVIACYEWGNLDKVKYGLLLDNARNTQDNNNSVWSDWQYEVSTWGIEWFKDLFCLDVWPNVSYSMYCAYCSYSSNLFGCVGLKNKEYCVFNKQYTKEEYNQIVPKIIEHMMETWERWEFFDFSISPFRYNESAAFEYFPLTKEQSLKYGITRYDKKENISNEINNIQDNIDDVSDDILNITLVCEKTWRLFKIIKQELDFYKKYGLPIPKKHPDVRHNDRFNKKPKRTLYLRNCDNCNIETTSLYSQEVDLKVFCSKCYKNTIN